MSRLFLVLFDFLKRNNSLILLFLSIIYSLSCSQLVLSKPKEKVFMLDTLINGKRLMVKDTTKYSHQFILQLKRGISHNESMKVIGDSVWVTYKMFNSRRDTVVTSVGLIPTVLTLNESFRYTSTNPSSNLVLFLKRTNYTDIEYVLEIDRKAIQKGTARLQGSFYFEKEVFPDEKTGDQLFLDQYIYDGDHWTVIKIETSKGQKVIFTSDDPEVKKLGEFPLFSRN